MPIPKRLNANKCHACSGFLGDSDFSGYGVAIYPEYSVFFDYKCPSCKVLGRWIVNIAGEPDPVVGLRMMIELLEEAAAPKEERGDIRSQLNKIHNVNDLLRLGGTNAPRELPRTDGLP